MKGDNIFIGYWKNPSQYTEVVKDGWFFTGDYGELIDDKYYFKDRKKDLIIVAGMNIQPSELEEVAYSFDFVKECAVFSIPDKIYGERIVMAIYSESIGLGSREKMSTFESLLISKLKSSLSNFKIPSKIYFSTQALPKTQSGKIIRRLVKESFLKNILE